MGRGTRPTSDSGVLPVKWSKGADGVLLVRPLPSLAPDLEVEESNSELAQKETISSPRGISSRGEMMRHRSAFELRMAGVGANPALVLAGSRDHTPSSRVARTASFNSEIIVPKAE